MGCIMQTFAFGYSETRCEPPRSPVQMKAGGLIISPCRSQRANPRGCFRVIPRGKPYLLCFPLHQTPLFLLSWAPLFFWLEPVGWWCKVQCCWLCTVSQDGPCRFSVTVMNECADPLIIAHSGVQRGPLIKMRVLLQA